LVGRAVVVDVEIGTRLRADERVPFACRAARLAQWGVVDPRRVDWALCLPEIVQGV
jgi:hypothetical protein